jgi:hypothetical protein
MSMYDEFTKDFAARTLENLNYIETAEKNGKTTYEVTQLINSFLGLIVFPQEQDEERVGRVSIDPKIIDNLCSGVMENTYTDQYEEVNLQNLIYHFRNAISHGHIKPHADKDKKIFGLEFYDCNPYKKKEEFRIKVEISLLREFVRAFAEGLIRTYED